LQQGNPLVDHLVGAGDERRGHINAHGREDDTSTAIGASGLLSLEFELHPARPLAHRVSRRPSARLECRFGAFVGSLPGCRLVLKLRGN
jgi:hypothetical protein